ncbi:ROK family protein [Oceanobacillus sp. M65]|uniref:ROK family protein n=1 Tax=Oceanobacillus sp. M65 TaxID=3457435 RepID=UPI003FCC5CA8
MVNLNDESLAKGQSGTTVNILFFINILLTENKVEQGRIKGIGGATAGIIDSEEKIINYTNNLGLKSFSIGSMFQENFQLPVKLSNDANATAI